jgi:hypothetical protein
MIDTVGKFIQLILEDAEESYERDTTCVARWWHRNNATQLYLSPDLFSRLLREEGILGSPNQISLVGIVVRNQKHPKICTDFTIDMHEHYQIGYDAQSRGLSPSDS